MGRHFLYIDNGKTKVCSKCKQEKLLVYFRKIKNDTQIRSDCKECEKINDHKYKNINRLDILRKSKERYKNNLTNSLLNNAKGRANKKKLKFNLDLNYINQLWKNCNGKCELSNISFELKVYSKPHPFRSSLDRIDNSKGYVKGNVRIILWALNRAINDTGFEVYYKIAKEVINNNNNAAKIYFGEFARENELFR